MKIYAPPLTPAELEIIRQHVYTMSYNKIAGIINQGRPFHEHMSGPVVRKRSMEAGIIRDKQKRNGAKKERYAKQFFNPHEFAEWYR